MICSKLHLNSIFWEFVRTEHDPSIVSANQRIDWLIDFTQNWKWMLMTAGWDNYIRRLRGRLVAVKLSAKSLIDLSEDRSIFIVVSLAAGFDSRIVCFDISAASMFRAATIIWAPRSARTLTTSSPIPLAPPANIHHIFFYKARTFQEVISRLSTVGIWYFSVGMITPYLIGSRKDTAY